MARSLIQGCRQAVPAEASRFHPVLCAGLVPAAATRCININRPVRAANPATGGAQGGQAPASASRAAELSRHSRSAALCGAFLDLLSKPFEKHEDQHMSCQMLNSQLSVNALQQTVHWLLQVASLHSRPQ